MVSTNLDNEIQLKDLLHALWQKKLFILSVTILCAVLGFTYASYSKPVYKASAVIMPPSKTMVHELNKTDLKLFTEASIFEIFTLILKSEDAKYTFFKEYILPQQSKNDTSSDNELTLYQNFSKTLRIDMVPGTNNYRITATNINPAVIPQRINQYIQYVNQLAFNEVISISKKEHERKALLIQQDMNFIRDIVKKRIQSQLIVLAEALDIAEAAGIKQPSKNREVISSFDTDPAHLYHNGTEPLKALMHNLSKRTNHDAFIPNFDILIKQHDFYKNYQLAPKNNQLYHLDGINIPASRASFSKGNMTITAFLLGLLSSVMLVLIQAHFFKNKQTFTETNRSTQNEHFAFR